MKSRILFPLIVASLVWFPAGAVHAQTSPTNEIMAFADHLCASGDYYRAITEYKRFLFTHPDQAQVPVAEYKIALCYYLGEKWETAEALFLDLKERYPDHEVGRQAMLMLAQTYYMRAEYHLAADELREFIKAHPDKPCADAAGIMMCMCLLHLEKMESARESLKGISVDSTRTEQAQAVADAIQQYARIPQKEPWLAGALSAVLPGAGQLYIQRPWDALLSFLLNGTFVFAAVEAFDRDETVAGAMVTFVEVGWYFGNIYNAASGAHKYNRMKKQDFFHDLELQYGLNLFNMDGNNMCPSLGFKLQF